MSPVLFPLNSLPQRSETSSDQRLHRDHLFTWQQWAYCCQTAQCRERLQGATVANTGKLSLWLRAILQLGKGAVPPIMACGLRHLLALCQETSELGILRFRVSHEAVRLILDECIISAITGQCLPIFHSDGLEFAYFGQDLCESVCEPIKVITLVTDW